jgi:hypothetical protein
MRRIIAGRCGAGGYQFEIGHWRANRASLHCTAMNDLSTTVANGFAGTYRLTLEKITTLCEPLSQEAFWTRPYPYGNSIGHLMLHLIGNLSFYIGTSVAQTGYVRDRDREFTEDRRPPKHEVLQRLKDTVEMVVATLNAQASESWSSPYEAEGFPAVDDRFTMFLRCASHFQQHYGQMIYLAYAQQESGAQS